MKCSSGSCASGQPMLTRQSHKWTAYVLIVGLRLVDATRRSRSVQPQSSSGSCDWTIHYGRWIPEFENRIYVAKSSTSGAQCLEACCRDPTCTGLAIESTMDSQCYKYRHVPMELRDDPGQPLASYVTAPKQQAWSVFMKASTAGVDPRAEAPSMLLWEEEASLPALRLVQQEEAIDARLRRKLEPPHVCEWTVYYDKWIPSFQGGEYEPNNAYGGAHCLQACCEDPSCKGLAMESNEMYQCYKYGTLPAALDKMHDGQPLRDGAWLRHKRTAWSIMVKVEKLLPPAGAAHGSLQHHSQTMEAESQPASVWNWGVVIAHVLALVAMIGLLVGSLLSVLQRAELTGRKWAYRGGSRDPEAASLLEAVGPLKPKQAN